MDIHIHKAEKADSTVLRQLLEYYCYDFSEYLHTDVNAHGRFEYAYLDMYWVEEGRHPYFIKVEGKYAGFVLVNKDFKILRDPSGHAMAEFFVMRKYRSKGIGSYVAQKIFELYPGAWEISQVMANEASVKFWNQVVGKYTQGEYTQTYMEKTGSKRQVLTFTI